MAVAMQRLLCVCIAIGSPAAGTQLPIEEPLSRQGEQVSLLQVHASQSAVSRESVDARFSLFEWLFAWTWPWSREAKRTHARCDLEMANIASDLHHDRSVADSSQLNATALEEYLNGEGWAMSKAMFDFLGETSRTAFKADEDKVICEAGFRYGTTAMAFLCIGNATTVRSYSRKDDKYVQMAADHVKSRYPGKLDLLTGDTASTVPQSASAEGFTPCGLIYIDGGRGYEVVKEDIQNLAKVSKPDAMILLDGCGNATGGPRTAFDEAADSGLIIDPDYKLDVKGSSKTICVGRFTSSEMDTALEALRGSAVAGDSSEPNGADGLHEAEAADSDDDEEDEEELEIEEHEAAESEREYREQQAKGVLNQEEADLQEVEEPVRAKRPGKVATVVMMSEESHSEEVEQLQEDPQPGELEGSAASEEEQQEEEGSEEAQQQPKEQPHDPESLFERTYLIRNASKESLWAKNQWMLMSEHRLNVSKVEACGQEMAEVVASMKGDRSEEAMKRYAAGENWAINKGMFEFLGQMAEKELAKVDTEKVVCETGFRLGTTALAFTCFGGATQVRSYNRRQGDEVSKAEQLIHERYPHTLVVVHGQSEESVKDSLGVDGWLPCNVILVNGGKRYQTVEADLQNFAKWATPGALVMVDGCSLDSPWEKRGARLAFDKAVADGLVQEENYITGVTHYNKTVCTGRFTGAEAAAAQADLITASSG